MNPDDATPHAPRNPGLPVDDGAWLAHAQAPRVNAAAIARRAASLAARRSVKGVHQAAWLVRAIECMDLTTLAGDDTPERVRRLCRKARRPLAPAVADALGVPGVKVAAVCVYHELVATAVDALAGSGVAVAAVSTGFPAGLSPLATRLREVELSVAAGAGEIDIVIRRGHVLAGDWAALWHEVRAFREACGDAHLKAILATGELQTLDAVVRASWTCMAAGADFIKTSTGKEGVNATPEVSLAMVRAIRGYHALTGHAVGYKPAGGIAGAKTALAYLQLMKEELDAPWLTPRLFRLGASSLLTDIERQLDHHLHGAYSASWRHALP